MKVTIIGKTTDEKHEDAEMVLEFMGGNNWKIKLGKLEITTTDLEKSMEFLKNQSEK